MTAPAGTWARPATSPAPSGVVIAAAVLVLPDAVHGPAVRDAVTEHGPRMDAAARAVLGMPARELTPGGRHVVPAQVLCRHTAAHYLPVLLGRLGRGGGAVMAEVVDCDGYRLADAAAHLAAIDGPLAPLAGVLLIARPAERVVRAGALS